MLQPTNNSDQASTANSAAVRWLPGNPFVVQTLNLSSELTGEDLLSAVELAIESASPVPMEQLAWGWYRDPAGPRVLIYMSLREMCLRMVPDFEVADFVYPAFLAALNEPAKEPSIRVVLTSTDLSAVYFGEDPMVPEWIVSRQHGTAIQEALSVDADDAALKAAIRVSLDGLKTVIPKDQQPLLPDSVLQIAEARVDSNHSVHVTINTIDLNAADKDLEAADESPEERLLLTGDTPYQCDLRDENFQFEKRKRHRIADRLWTGLVAAGAAAAILLVLLILNLASSAWRQFLNAEIEAQIPAVNRVEEKESLLAGIELFSTAALQPFQALEVMNATRPNTLYFRNLRAGAEGGAEQETFFIRMRGIASSAAEVDRFAAGIRNNPLFSKVELSDVRSRNNRTDFNLNIQIPANSEVTQPGP